MTASEVAHEPTAEKEVDNVDNSDDSDDDMPELENAGEAGDKGSKVSRGEKKARKAVSKLGLKHMPEVNRVTIRRNKNILFVVAKPDVYKSPQSDTYVVFGEPKVEDLNARAQANAAQQFQQQMPSMDAAAGGAAAAPAMAAVADAAGDDGDEGDVDETGMKPEDIDMVMQQASVSRPKAVKALKANNGDLVNAIMELTM
eukprot:Nk52_evm22s304 gene=Nk52_evmTU22s304